ncbi:glycosyltransferase family 2 protein [Mesorhizobium sp. 1B3]|uniref:glycosyltransferase family 2 protein n=1 Tax=Mesorhizobium sp. 1B3 TaxID=3243599 RepID=UPI003D9810D9
MAHSIDVVVPCYRYGHFLKECVESVLSQGDVDARILIIDDASPDDSAEVASSLAHSDSRVLFRRHPVNMGHIATYNEGIEWASAEYFLLLSADDYLLPGSLGRSTRLLSGMPEVGFAFGAATVLNEDGTSLPVHPLGRAPGFVQNSAMDGRSFFRLSGAKNIVPTPTAVVRTKLQKDIGGYRQDLPHSGDMEMWMRLAMRAPVGFVDEYQAVYRQHGSNMSLTYFGEYILRDLEERRKAIECLFECDPRMQREGDDIRSGLLRDLAAQAINEASVAFNRRNPDLSNAIARFAVELVPTSRLSLPWMKLALKRAMGANTWLSVRSFVNHIAVRDNK